MGRPSAWVREKEVQLDLALLEQKENDRIKEKGRKNDGKDEQEPGETQLILTKGMRTAESDYSPKKKVAPEDVDTSGEIGLDTKKVGAAPESALQKAPKGASSPTESLKSPAISTTTEKASQVAGAAIAAEVAKRGEPDVTTGGKTTEAAKHKDGKAQVVEDPEQTRARTAAEVKADGERAAALQRAQEEADRETAVAKKRAEARAAAAANLKAYTLEQMTALRREKFGEDVGSMAPPPGSNAKYYHTDTGRRGLSQVCLNSHVKAQVLTKRLDCYVFIKVRRKTKVSWSHHPCGLGLTPAAISRKI